jgi:hypothetical protein
MPDRWGVRPPTPLSSIRHLLEERFDDVLARVVSEVTPPVGRTLGRKMSLTVAVVAAVYLLLLIVELLTDGFGVGLLELALLAMILAAGVAWVWWPRRA